MAFAVALSATISVVLVFRVASLERRISALSRLESKIDALLKHEGAEWEPGEDAPAAVVEAIRRGQKIEAIKLYREASGAGLKDSKEFVEALQARMGMPG